MMNGPELYVIKDSDEKVLIVVWKPNIDNTIEIMDYTHNKNILLDDNSNFSDIKNQLIKMLDINIIECNKIDHTLDVSEYRVAL